MHSFFGRADHQVDTDNFSPLHPIMQDGSFWMPWEEFTKFFGVVQVCDPRYVRSNLENVCEFFCCCCVFKFIESGNRSPRQSSRVQSFIADYEGKFLLIYCKLSGDRHLSIFSLDVSPGNYLSDFRNTR